MRKKRNIDALFPHIRQSILSTLLLSPDKWWYLSGLAKQLGVTPSTLQKELVSLTEAGILRSRQDGNRVYYQADETCPFLSELQGLMLKTTGLVDELKHTLKRFKKNIAVAFVYGSVARGEELSTSDVDLMIIGNIGLAELAPALNRAESKIRREVNASTYSPEEFAKKAAEKQHFIQTLLDEEKLFVVGNSDDLEAVIKRKAG